MADVLLLGSVEPEKDPVMEFKVSFPTSSTNTEKVVSCPGQFAIYPVLEKKNKLRSCLIVLRNCICEIHKSDKDFEECKPANHCIDLRLVFNVCIVRDVTSIKGESVCVQTPNDTYFIVLDKSTMKLYDFFAAFLDRSCDARSTMLIRQLHPEEYFEVSFDVQAVKKPKLHKEYPNLEKLPDLAVSYPEMTGRRRLCVRSAAIVLFKTGVTITSNPEAPFPEDSFFEFPINMISTFGRQEKYFFMHIGRCSVYGHGEIWLQCESNGGAAAMHEQIDIICQRESEKRRNAGIILAIPGMSQQMIKSRQYRERSQTMHALEREREEQIRRDAMTQKQKDEEERKKKEEEELQCKAQAEASAKFYAEKRRIKMETRRLKNGSRADKIAAITSFFRFGRKKRDEIDLPERTTYTPSTNHAFPPGYPFLSSDEDYYPYDYQDTRKHSYPTRQAILVPKPKPIPVPKDYVQMENLAEKYAALRAQEEEEQFPFLPAQAFIKLEGADDSSVASRSKKKKRSVTSSRNNLESGVSSIGGPTSKTLGSGHQESVTPSSPLQHSWNESSAGSASEENKTKEDHQPSTSEQADESSKQLPKTLSVTENRLNRQDAPKMKEDDEAIDGITDLIDIRKRAHSLGSRSWIKSSALRKFTSKFYGSSKDSKDETDADKSKAGSQVSWAPDIRNSNLKKDEENDLVEIDFGKSTKIGDTPLDRSRNSSIGIKTPADVRTALDRVLEDRRKTSKHSGEYDRLQKEIEERAKRDAEKQKKKSESAHVPKERRLNNSSVDSSTSEAPTAEEEDDDYIPMNPGSAGRTQTLSPIPGSSKHEKEIVAGTQSNADINDEGSRRHRCHRESCKKNPKDKDPSPESLPSLDSDTDLGIVRGIVDSINESVGSSESLEETERGDGLVRVVDKLADEELRHMVMMRPMSKSIGGNSLSSKDRHHHKRTTKGDCSKCEYPPVSVGARSMTGMSRTDHKSPRISSSASGRHASTSGNNRFLRSPSPKNMVSKADACANPSCSLCQAGVGRLRTSFIDSTALLSSPCSSRKHSTTVPMPREKHSSISHDKRLVDHVKKVSIAEDPTSNEWSSPVVEEKPPRSLRRKSANVLTRKTPIVFDEQLPYKLLDVNEIRGNRRVRSNSPIDKSSVNYHHYLAKQGYTRGYFASMDAYSPSVDYVEIIPSYPRPKKSTKKCRGKKLSSSSSEQSCIIVEPN